MTLLENFQNLMGELQSCEKSRIPNLFDPAFFKFVVQINQKLQDCLKSQLNRLVDDDERLNSMKPSLEKDKGSANSLGINQEKQLQAWKDNPTWVDQPPVVKVNTQKGSLCHLNLEVNVGLTPDAVYDIFTDPENKKYFRNIKENISRRVLIDEGSRLLVEVEQAAAWKFLWWSGTFPVHLLVDQNREDHSSKYKQGRSRFMNTFEGCWRVEPLFVDEHLCDHFKPKTLQEYCSCTGGRGRIGSKVTMEQLFQPAALLTPPPISWYVRGITLKTTETMIEDLLAEAARIRGGFDSTRSSKEDVLRISEQVIDEEHVNKSSDIKKKMGVTKKKREDT